MTAALLDRLARNLRSAPVHIADTTALAVAFSGGVDSAVLLAAVHKLGITENLRCIHVDHQLHAESAGWLQFCRASAQRLGIEFVSRTVQCSVGDQGLEAAARVARYDAFADELRQGEVLLTAHHADDQLETLLYRLVRGTGVDGLRGIRVFEPLGPGYLMRPFLHETRAAIVEQANALGLQWLDDPSNQDTRFDRNYLRLSVLPAILQRWPQAGQAAIRLTASAEDARELAEALAVADLAGIDAPDKLPLSRLSTLTPARQRNVLRVVIRRLRLPLPDAAALARICSLVEADSDAAVVTWPGGQARRYAGALFLQQPRTSVPTTALRLVPGQPLVIAHGSLELERAPAPALPDSWVQAGLLVRFRAGGERYQAAGAGQAVALREWMRTRGVLPWMRDAIPLLYHGRELVAVGDLSVSAAAAAEAGSAGGWRVVWRNRPRTD